MAKHVTKIVCCVVVAGTFLVSYVRARAEPLVGRCDVGFAERAERVILFGGGLVIGIDVAALLALAVLTHVTLAQRLIYVRHQLQEDSPDCDAAVSDDEKLADSNVRGEI